MSVIGKIYDRLKHLDDSDCTTGPPNVRPDMSTVAKRNAFYSSQEYRDMTTAEKCAVQRDGFINDYD